MNDTQTNLAHVKYVKDLEGHTLFSTELRISITEAVRKDRYKIENFRAKGFVQKSCLRLIKKKINKNTPSL